MRLPAASARQSLLTPEMSPLNGCLSQIEAKPVDPVSTINQQVIVPANLNSGHYVYSYGYIKAYFSSLSVEKEFFQAIDEDRSISKDEKAIYQIQNSSELKRLNEQLNQQDILYKTLSKPENFYIAREMCWLFQVQKDINLYVLQAVNNYHLKQLISALKPEKNIPQQKLAISGLFIPSAFNMACQALGLSSLKLSKINQVNPESFYGQAYKEHCTINKDKYLSLVDEILQLSQNEGRSDADRALNFLLLTQASVYTLAYNLLYNCKEQNNTGSRLTDVQSESIYQDSSRKVIKLIFSFQNLSNASIEKWFCSLDISGEYPFIVEDLRRYIGI